MALKKVFEKIICEILFIKLGGRIGTSRGLNNRDMDMIVDFGREIDTPPILTVAHNVTGRFRGAGYSVSVVGPVSEHSFMAVIYECDKGQDFAAFSLTITTNFPGHDGRRKYLRATWEQV